MAHLSCHFRARVPLACSAGHPRFQHYSCDGRGELGLAVVGRVAWRTGWVLLVLVSMSLTYGALVVAGR
jgi:hypothetical protein